MTRLGSVIISGYSIRQINHKYWQSKLADSNEKHNAVNL